MGFPGGSVVKNLPVNTGDMSSIPGSGKIPWRKKWKPTPIFLPVKSHGQRSLASYGPGGHKRQTQLSMHACTHTHTHTRTWDTRGTGSTGPFPLLGGFPEAFHELSNLCVPKYLILKLLYTTHHSHSARLFSASTRLSSPRAGTALSHCPAQSVTAPVQQGHTHTGFF